MNEAKKDDRQPVWMIGESGLKQTTVKVLPNGEMEKPCVACGRFRSLYRLSLLTNPWGERGEDGTEIQTDIREIPGICQIGCDAEEGII